MSIDFSQFGFIPDDDEKASKNKDEIDLGFATQRAKEGKPFFAKEEEQTPIPSDQDLSQFGFIPDDVDSPEEKDEPTKFHKFVKRPSEIFIGGGSAGIRSLPRTSFELLKTIVEKTGGNLENLEKFQKESPQFVKDLANKLFPTFEQERERQFKLGVAKPETAFERGLEKAGRFTGESLILGGIGGVKGALGIAGAATGAQIGEEFKLNPYIQMGLSLGGSFLGHGLGAVKSSLIKQKFSPQVERYIEASRLAGIDPIALGMNPTMLQKVAQKWATHGIGGPKILEEAYRSRSAQVSRAFETALEASGEELFTTSFDAGTQLKQSIIDATKQVEITKSQLFKAVDRTIPKDAAVRLKPGQGIQVKELFTSIEDSIDVLSENISLARPESIELRRLVDAKKTLVAFNKRGIPKPKETKLLDQFGNVVKTKKAPVTQELGIKELENTKRSLGNVINWQKPGGVDKLLIPTWKKIDGLLTKYGKTNPQYQTAKDAANQYFINDVVHIRQNILQSIARSERPESTLANMNTISGIKNVEKALGSLPNGQRMVNSLKRFKLDTMLRDKIINPSTKLMKINGLQNFLSRNSKDFNIIRELAGSEGIKQLKILENVGKGLEKGFNNLVNPSKTADTLIAINSIFSPGKDLTSAVNQAFRGNFGNAIGKSATAVLKVFGPSFLAKALLKPEFANKVFRLSQSAKANNWSTFNRILDSLDNSMKNPKEDKE